MPTRHWDECYTTITSDVPAQAKSARSLEIFAISKGFGGKSVQFFLQKFVRLGKALGTVTLPHLHSHTQLTCTSIN